MKRIVALFLALICVFGFVGCASDSNKRADQTDDDVTGACEHVWETIENLDEYTSVQKCAKCRKTRRYTDTEGMSYSGDETGFNMLRYNWDGYGVSKKEIKDCELASKIIDCLWKLEETGEIIPKISDDPIGSMSTELPIERGTLWIECGTLGLFRVDPDTTEICKVESHLGKGVALKMHDTLSKLIGQAWYHYPYDSWSGKYENGEATLNHVFESDSVIESVKIEDVDYDSDRFSKNTITLSIVAKESVNTNIRLQCSNGGDVIGSGDSKDIQLIANEEVKVKLGFGGLFENWIHRVTITVDQTKVSVAVYPKTVVLE